MVVRRNMLANLIGRGWSMLLGVAVIPVYLKLLGIEAYGLIGFFTSLQALFGILDLGLGTTVNRELARLSAREGTAGEQREVIRTLETVYWGISLVAGLSLVALAPAIARGWLEAKGIPPAELQRAIVLMGVVIALQFPIAFYQGGLTGLQRQVAMNAIMAGTATLKSVGAVLLLWLVSPTIDAFFGWQVVAAAIGTFVCMRYLWAAVPPGAGRARFRSAVLRRTRGFTGAVAANAIVGVLLTQTDKIILSRTLSLESFGYYALAATVASFLWSIILPVNTAMFPRFAQLYETGDRATLASTYHRASQLMSVVLLPLCMIGALFSRDIIALWTGSPSIADNAHLIVSILVVGTTLNGLASVAVYLQCAAGWPQLVLYVNTALAVVLVPSMLLVVSRFGAVGAALLWMAINITYVCLLIPIMHTRLLIGEMRQWYVHDVLIPALGVLAATGAALLIAPSVVSWSNTVPFLVAAWLLATVAAAGLAPAVRQTLLQIPRLPRAARRHG